MSTAHVSSVAASLGLESVQSVARYIDFVNRHAPPRDTLCLYDHLLGKQYALHGTECIALAARLNVDDIRAAETLTAGSLAHGNTSLETLTLSPRAARDLAAAALFAAGKKVTLVAVRGDKKPEIKATASPGNVAPLAEYLDLDAAADAMPTRPLLDEGQVIALKVGKAAISGGPSQQQLGIVAWDDTRRTFSFAQLQDDEVYSALEGILVAANAKELLVCEGDLSEHERAKLSSVLEECGVALTELSRRSFGVSSSAGNGESGAVADLERLVGSSLPLVRFLDMKLAVCAAAAQIKFHDMDSKPELDGTVSVAELDHTKFMHLDTAALRALNVIAFAGDGGGGKRSTLYGLLNRTKTPMGSRLLRRWLAQPLQDLDEINTRLNVVSAWYNAVEARGAVRDENLHRMPDLNLLVRRFTKNGGLKASLQDVVRLYQCSVRLPKLVRAIENSQRENDGETDILASRYANKLSEYIQELANFEALVEMTIDLDVIDNGEFVINPKIDQNLAHLRKSQDSLLADIAEEHQNVIQALRPPKEDSLKLERKDNLGYVFRVTRRDEKLIRDKSSKYHVIETRKDGVRFVTNTLRNLSAEYDDAAKEYKRQETELRSKTLQVVATYVDVFTNIASLVAELDCVLSFATVAASAREEYVRPNMIPAGGGLVITNARHAMVEECLEGEFIANDIDLQRGVEGEDGGALLLVTGPNGNGKSTYIRTAGVITLMAHLGCFVPASSASVPLTDRILCRVGAADNQHRGVSTFMSEMLETSTILKLATKHSLIIIDELGRGTGVSDGYGLAHAICHHIVNKLRTPTLFATHFHELTTSLAPLPAVRNLSVSALTNPDGITFLYNVVPGACGKSFGIHVAELARFPPQVVSAAKRKLAELELEYGSDARNKKARESVAAQDESVREEGMKLVTDFLERVAALTKQAGDGGADSDTLQEAVRLRNEVLAKGNAYVQAIVEA